MKTILKLEELAMLALSVWAIYFFDLSFWFYLVMLVGPDISMLGYLFGNKAGAFFYNLFHHKGVAIALFVLGLSIDNEALIAIGIVLFGHSSLDRLFGYGLKYDEGFKFTHLGAIGKTG